MSASPFFIVGVSRSGTTMLNLMMNMHADLFIPKETWFLSDLMDNFDISKRLSKEEVESIFSIVVNHWRWKEWEADPAVLHESLSRMDKPFLADVVNMIYQQPLFDSGKKRWGDKTPGYLSEIQRLSILFSNSKFIHIIRDGRDVAISLKRVGWLGDTMWDIACHWRDLILEGRRQGAALSGDRYYEFKYEDLVLDPEGQLRKICGFLGEDFDVNMLSFHERAKDFMPKRNIKHLLKTQRPPSKSDIQRWKTELSPVQVFIFESIAGEALMSCGYDMKYHAWITKLSFVFDMIRYLVDVTLPFRSKLGVKFGWIKKWL